MIAPKIIYIHYGQLGLPQATEHKITDNDIEYIRKDALLKWAKDNSSCEQGFDDGGAEHGYRTALQDLIEILNSM